MRRLHYRSRRTCVPPVVDFTVAEGHVFVHRPIMNYNLSSFCFYVAIAKFGLQHIFGRCCFVGNAVTPTVQYYYDIAIM